MIAMTFYATETPKKMLLDSTQIHEGPFVPRPQRCFCCQAFGHTQRSCKRKVWCAKCSVVDHSEKDCRDGVVRCFNCSVEHKAYSSGCPRWLKEKHIAKIKARQNITYKESREKVENEDKAGYAAALKSPDKTPKTKPLTSFMIHYKCRIACTCCREITPLNMNGRPVPCV